MRRKADLAVANQNNTVSLLLGNGTGGVTSTTIFNVGNG